MLYKVMVILRLAWRNTVLYPRYWRVAQLSVSSVLERHLKFLDVLAKLRSEYRGVGLELVGDGRDGSYVIPKNTSARVLMSPGVGYTSKFELSLAEKGFRVYLADASVAGPAESHENFVFKKEFIGLGANHLSFDSWLKESTDDHEPIVVQMDVEGGEWTALDVKSLSRANLLRIEWIALELHELETLFALTFKGARRRRVLSRILDSHCIVFSRPNNCGGRFHYSGHTVPSLLEVTLLRRDLCVEEPGSLIPKVLFQNCPEKPAIPWSE